MDAAGIRNLANELGKLASDMDSLKDTSKQLDAAKSELAGVRKQIETTDAELTAVQQKKKIAEAKTMVDLEAAINDKTNELQAVTTKTAKAKADLEEFRVKLSSAKTTHEQVLSSIESLKKRLG